MKNQIFKSNRAGNNSVFLVSFWILIIATCLSKYYDYSNYIIYPVWIVLMVGIMISKCGLDKNEKTFVHVSLALLAIIVFYWLFGFSSMAILGLLESVNWLLWGVVAIYALKLLSGRELTSTYFVMCIFLFILLLAIIREGRVILAIDQYEAAMVANAWYGSLYMLITGLSLIFFLNVKSFMPRIIALFVFLLTLFLNFVVLQRGTNVIFTAAEIFLILIFIIKKKSIVYTLFTIILGVVIMFASSSNDTLLKVSSWLADVSPSERLSLRFDQISMALAYEDIAASGRSMSQRSDLMEISWNTFTSGLGHFFFGVGEHDQANEVIGHHSFILDTLARYGVIGGILLFIYFKKQYQILMSYVDKKRDWTLYMQCAVVFLFYVLRNFYGVLSYSLVNLVLLVLFPLTIQYIHFYTISNKKTVI